MKQWSLGCLGDCFYIFINIWVSHNVCHQVAKVVVPGISKGTTAMQITFKKTSTGERLFLFPMTHKKKSNQHHWSSQRHPRKSGLEPCLVSKPGSHCSWQGSTRKSKLKTRVNDTHAEGGIGLIWGEFYWLAMTTSTSMGFLHDRVYFVFYLWCVLSSL